MTWQQASSKHMYGCKTNAMMSDVEWQLGLVADLCREASGHGWNQSMTVELMVARKR